MTRARPPACQHLLLDDVTAAAWGQGGRVAGGRRICAQSPAAGTRAGGGDGGRRTSLAAVASRPAPPAAHARAPGSVAAAAGQKRRFAAPHRLPRQPRDGAGQGTGGGQEGAVPGRLRRWPGQRRRRAAESGGRRRARSTTPVSTPIPPCAGQGRPPRRRRQRWRTARRRAAHRSAAQRPLRAVPAHGTAEENHIVGHCSCCGQRPYHIPCCQEARCGGAGDDQTACCVPIAIGDAPRPPAPLLTPPSCSSARTHPLLACSHQLRTTATAAAAPCSTWRRRCAWPCARAASGGQGGAAFSVPGRLSRSPCSRCGPGRDSSPALPRAVSPAASRALPLDLWRAAPRHGRRLATKSSSGRRS